MRVQEYTAAQKNAILHRFVNFFTSAEPAYSSEHKVKVLQVLIIPALTASFLKQETSEVVDPTLVAAIVNNILDPTSPRNPFPSSSPFATSAPSLPASTPALVSPAAAAAAAPLSGASPAAAAAPATPAGALVAAAGSQEAAKSSAKTLLPGSRAPYDEALSIELLQLATLLVRCAPPFPHHPASAIVIIGWWNPCSPVAANVCTVYRVPCVVVVRRSRFMPNELVEHRKELIKFAWNHLKSEDTTSKQCAYVLVCRFIEAYETPPKIILQVNWRRPPARPSLSFPA